MSPGIMHQLPGFAAVLVLFHLVMASDKSSATQTKDDSTMDRLLKEAPEKWAEYENIAQQFQGTETVEVEEQGNEEQKYGCVNEFKHNNDCKLIRSYDLAEKQPEFVLAFNPLYGFELTRKNKSSPYVLRRLKMHGDKDESMTLFFEDSALVKSALVTACYCSLRDLFRQPNFKLRDVRLVKRDDEELVEVSFLNTHDIKTRPSCPIQGGTLVLDPNRYWCVRSGEVVCRYLPGSMRIKFEISLRDSPAGYPVPISCVEDKTPTTAPAEGLRPKKVRRQYDFQVPTRLPDTTQFTLSAFGLPEPPGVTWRKPTPWYLWVTGIGVALVGVGVVVRRALQRYASR
mgnify:CR=1 FL=1